MFKIADPASIHTDIDAGHGRVETRKYTVVDDLRFFDVRKEWDGLRTIIKIESERYIKSDKKTQKETRFYISGLPADAGSINKKSGTIGRLRTIYIGC